MRTALLIIDLQQGLHSATAPLFQLDELLNRTNQRIAARRAAGDPIIFIQHQDDQLVPNSTAWSLFTELASQPTDYFVSKTHLNAFYRTDLPELLTRLAVTDLEIIGAQTEYCMDTTIRFGHGIGYQLHYQAGMSTTTDSDLLSAETILAHHETLWRDRFVTFTD